MRRTLIPILYFLISSSDLIGVSAQEPVPFRPPAIIRSSPLDSSATDSDQALAINTIQDNRLPDFAGILQDPIIFGTDPGPTILGANPVLDLQPPAISDNPIPLPGQTIDSQAQIPSAAELEINLSSQPLGLPPAIVDTANSVLEPPVGAVPEIPTASNAIFERPRQSAGRITDTLGVPPPEPIGIHVDLPGQHRNNNSFAILHIPDSVPGHVHDRFPNLHGITHQPLPSTEGLTPSLQPETGPGFNLQTPDQVSLGPHVDQPGTHGHLGPGPFIHRPEQDLNVPHVDPHGNRGPGHVIHRPGQDHKVPHIDPPGRHGNKGPGFVIHRPGQDHNVPHVDPPGRHGNKGPGHVIHRPGKKSEDPHVDIDVPHVDPPGRHGNKGPGHVIHRPGKNPNVPHVDPPGRHGNKGPGHVIHRPGKKPEDPHLDIDVPHVDPPGRHGNKGPGHVIHRPGKNPNVPHVDPPGRHGNKGPGHVIHRPGKKPEDPRLDIDVPHVDPPGRHGNKGPGHVIHRPGKNPNVPHVDPPGRHGNKGPGLVIHRPGQAPNVPHVDPHGRHENRGPGHVIDISRLDADAPNVDLLGRQGDLGPGHVIHRPGADNHNGIQVDVTGFHESIPSPNANPHEGIFPSVDSRQSNAGVSSLIPGPSLTEGVRFDPVTVPARHVSEQVPNSEPNLFTGIRLDTPIFPGNVGTGVDTPIFPGNVGTGVDTPIFPGNVGTGVDTPIQFPVNVGTGVDTPIFPGNVGTGVDTPLFPGNVGTGVDVPIFPANVGTGVDTSIFPGNVGTGVDTPIFPGNVRTGVHIHRFEPNTAGSVPLDHLGPHRELSGVHGKPDSLGSFPRPILQVPISVGGPESFHKELPNKPKSHTPLVSLVKSLANKVRRPSTGNNDIQFETLGVGGVSKLDKLNNYKGRLIDPIGSPSTFPIQATGFVDENTHFVDVPLNPLKKLPKIKPKHAGKLHGVVDLPKGHHIDFHGEHNNPHGPAVHTADGRHIPLDPAAKDPIGLPDQLPPGDIFSKPIIDPFKHPIVFVPRRRGKGRRHKFVRRGGKGRRRGKGKKWKGKRKPAIKPNPLLPVPNIVFPDTIHNNKRPDILLDKVTAIKGKPDTFHNKGYPDKIHSDILHGHDFPDKNFGKLPDIIPDKGYPERKPKVVHDKLIDIVKKPVVKPKPKKKKGIKIIHISHGRQAHPLQALRDIARRGIGSMMSRILRSVRWG